MPEGQAVINLTNNFTFFAPCHIYVSGMLNHTIDILCTYWWHTQNLVWERSRVRIPHKPVFVCLFVCFFLGFLFSTVKVASITAMIFFHIILHPAVLIGNFHIFITSLYNKCIINRCNSKFNGVFSLIRFSDTFYLVVSKHFFIPLIFLLDVSPPPSPPPRL